MDYRHAFDLTGSVAMARVASASNRLWRLGHARQRWSWRLEIGARWTRPLYV
jgi:hypothetical protein